MASVPPISAVNPPNEFPDIVGAKPLDPILASFRPYIPAPVNLREYRNDPVARAASDEGIASSAIAIAFLRLNRQIFGIAVTETATCAAFSN